MLGQHVERSFGDANAVEVARPGQQGGGAAFDQVADVGGHEQSTADLMNAVPGASHALQGSGDPLRRGQQHHQVDAPDVDAEFEGGGTHHGPQFSAFEPVFDVEAQFAVERGVVAFDAVCKLRHLLLEPVGSRFCAATGVGEHQGRAIRSNEFSQLADEALSGKSCLGIRIALKRAIHLQIHPFGRRGFDDRDIPTGASQEGGGVFARVHGGGKSDALKEGSPMAGVRWPARSSRSRQGRGNDLFESIQRQGELGTPLVLRERVQFIDDDPAHRGELW